MYIWTCVHGKLPSMGKKRLVIDLNDVDHAELVSKARSASLTVSNFVRKSTGLPLERQGVKRPELPPDVLKFFQETGRQGGKVGGVAGGKAAAEAMTPAERTARAKKAAAASAKVRSKKARKKA